MTNESLRRDKATTIEEFVLRARRVAAHSLAADPTVLLKLAQIEIKLHPDPKSGAMRIRMIYPPEEQLESLAARARPIILQGDPLPDRLDPTPAVDPAPRDPLGTTPRLPQQLRIPRLRPHLPQTTPKILLGARRAAGLVRTKDKPKYTPHSLRHFFASTALTNGIPIHEVSRWLGHKSIKTTADIYGHLMPGAWDRCREIMQNALRPLRSQG